MIIRTKQIIRQGEGYVPGGTLGVIKQYHERDVRFRQLSLEKVQQLIDLLGARAEEFLSIEDQVVSRCYFDGAALQSHYCGGNPGLLMMTVAADQLVGEYITMVDDAEISNQDRGTLNNILASIEDFEEALSEKTKEFKQERFTFRDIKGFGNLVAK